MKRKRLSSKRRAAAISIAHNLTNRMSHLAIKQRQNSAEFKKLDARLARLQSATRYR